MKYKMCIVLSLLLFLAGISSTGLAGQAGSGFGVVTTETRPLLLREKSQPVVQPAVLRQMEENLTSGRSLILWVFFTDKGIYTESAYRKNRLEVQGTFSDRALQRSTNARLEDIPPAQRAELQR